MVFLIKYSCACVGVNKLSDLTTCTVQIQSRNKRNSVLLICCLTLIISECGKNITKRLCN